MWAIIIKPDDFLYRPGHDIHILINSDDDLKEYVRNYFYEVVNNNMNSCDALDIILYPLNNEYTLDRNYSNLLLKVSRRNKPKIYLYAKWIVEYKSQEYNQRMGYETGDGTSHTG